MQTRTLNMAQLVGLDSGLPLKRVFRDRYELRTYVRALLLAKRLLENPGLIAKGQAYLERFVRTDPRQRDIYEFWSEAVRLPVGQLVSDLLADDERGASLRETAPVFVVIPPEQVTALARHAA
ncbi:MAG: hypothetical protein Q8Q88_06650 [Phenylobacterium sp.]|uniref:hypothetical protein n=1 Tax=Phenylobacterium sp. TaxID=1871053 RepID=UPI002733F6C8|nr:hypothetical protein [Phenylobacterium sp.]MDP3746714.1 hypothetical protein [Phenylobacterium sp.]